MDWHEDWVHPAASVVVLCCLFGRNDQRSEAGQRLGNFQELVLEEKEGEKSSSL